MDREILRLRWPIFADEFSEVNQGRPLSIEIVGDTLGDQEMAEATPFVALDYDDRTEAAILISVGRGEEVFTHTILNPEELWVHDDPDGTALALQVVASDGQKTILRFEDSS